MNTTKLSAFTAATKTIVAMLAVGALTASAQSTLTWDITPGTVGVGNNTITGGGGTWNTSNGNWTTDAGTNNIAWNNVVGTPKNDAIIGGTAGTVTLGEPISLRNLTINNTSGTYTITGSALNFTGGTIVVPNPPNTSTVGAVIRSNITGAPALNLTLMDGDDQFTLNPVTDGSMSIGTVSGNGGLGSERLNLQGGTGSSGTIAGGSGGNKFNVSSGAWTLNGSATGYGHAISGGTLTLKANLNASHRSVTLSGTGVLNYNAANAVSATAATSGAGSDNGFRLQTGATLDQTSGAAITTSTTNPSMTWEGNWTFLGSNGANSDLNLGTGSVFLKAASPQVTVSNAATTMIIGGVIANDDTAGRGLVKAGAGTLELRGVNTYTGKTTVNAGKLLIKSPGSLNASSAVSVNGGILAGNGTIHGPVTVSNLGSIAPGTPAAPTGILTINNNCTITNNLNIVVNGTQCSKLVVTNALTIVSGATINVTELTPPPVGARVIATYNTLVGTFATVNSTTSMIIDHNYQGLNQIALIRLPPGTVILLH